MSAFLTALQPIEALSPRVVRILGCNPGHMTLQGTNTYLIGTGNRRMLVDTGEAANKEYVSSLVSTLQQYKATLSDVVITHWHQDHIGGLCDVLTATNKNALVHKFPRIDKPDDPLPDWVQLRPLTHLQELTVEGATVRVQYTPGHSTDHVALELLPGTQEQHTAALLTGDCVLGEGTAVFQELYDYMKSLQALLDICQGPVYPGHGPVITDGASKISEYIAHRNAREQQILATLKTMTSTSPPALVKAVYKGIADSLLLAAENNLRLHLGKLVREGKVRQERDVFTAAEDNKL